MISHQQAPIIPENKKNNDLARTLAQAVYQIYISSDSLLPRRFHANSENTSIRQFIEHLLQFVFILLKSLPTLISKADHRIGFLTPECLIQH